MHLHMGHSFGIFLAQSGHAIKCPHGLRAWVKGLSRQITHLPIGSAWTFSSAFWSLLQFFRSSTKFWNMFCCLNWLVNVIWISSYCFLDSISCCSWSCFSSLNCFCIFLSSSITDSCFLSFFLCWFFKSSFISCRYISTISAVGLKLIVKFGIQGNLEFQGKLLRGIENCLGAVWSMVHWYKSVGRPWTTVLKVS